MSITKFEGEHRFLSNFWEVPIEFEKETYPTIEHAFQAAKSPDMKYRLKVRVASTPNMAKKLGQVVKLREDWEEVKLGIMETLVRAKFAQHHVLADALKNTGDQELIEGNGWGDTYWGVSRGKGENHLGKILMKIRTELGGT